MKIFPLFFMLMILFNQAYPQKGWRDHEMEVKVNIRAPGEASMLYNLHLNGDIHAPAGFAVMYLVPSELELVKETGLTTEVMKSDLNKYYKDFWSVKSDQYHDYNQIIALMDSLATAFPGICKKIVFGQTPQGRQLACLEISNNVDVDENEPDILFDAGIHGDEIGGPENLIRFARYLCTSYGNDPEITGLLNSREISIYPMVNPDGRANMSRYNSNLVDCNRDWGYMWNGNSPGAFSQLETRTMRDYIYNHRFVIQVSYHSGEEVVLYPWCYRAAHAPNYAAFLRLATTYSTSSGYPNLQYRQSYADYPTNGETIDYSYGADGTDALTMEISNNKQPPSSQIQYYYQNNVPAMIEMIKNAGYGIRGTVTDSITGLPVKASVFVNNFFPIYTDTMIGDYHIYLPPRTYSVKVVANNYNSKVINNVVVNDSSSVISDFKLQPATGHYATKIAAVAIPGNNPMDEANTPGVLGAPDSIFYSTGRNGWIILDMQDPVSNIPGDDFKVFEGDTTAEGYSCLVAQFLNGPWTSLGTGTGTTAFDLESAGLTATRFIKIMDDGDGVSNAANAGFDLDAVEAMVSTAGIKTTDDKAFGLVIYPNPANEKIVIGLQNRSTEGTVTIYNIRGEEVMTDQIRHNHLQFDISDLAAGVYFVRFANDKISVTGKLIKE